MGPSMTVRPHVNYKQKPLVYNRFHLKLQELGSKYSDVLSKSPRFVAKVPKLKD